MSETSGKNPIAALLEAFKDEDFKPISNAPWSRTPEPSTYHDNRLYVGNLPFTYNECDLFIVFENYGTVVSANIVTSEGSSKGFGFVTMDSVESCERARTALEGAWILGRELQVRRAVPLHTPPKPVAEKPNIPEYVQNSLRDLCIKESVDCMGNRRTDEEAKRCATYELNNRWTARRF